MTLRRFWVRFEQLPRPTAINLGCGVTALSLNDALSIIQERVFGDDPCPSIVECIEDVSLEQIEQKHARPNIGNVLRRGVWFPQGFD